MSETAKTSDARSAPRRRVLLSGKLTFGEGLSADCPIREESEMGARIIVGDHPLPKEVVLVSVTKGLAHEAEVVWRRGKEVGLRFHRTHKLGPDATGPATNVRLARRLWTEGMARGSE